MSPIKLEFFWSRAGVKLLIGFWLVITCYCIFSPHEKPWYPVPVECDRGCVIEWSVAVLCCSAVGSRASKYTAVAQMERKHKGWFPQSLSSRSFLFCFVHVSRYFLLCDYQIRYCSLVFSFWLSASIPPPIIPHVLPHSLLNFLIVPFLVVSHLLSLLFLFLFWFFLFFLYFFFLN